MSGKVRAIWGRVSALAARLTGLLACLAGLEGSTVDVVHRPSWGGQGEEGEASQRRWIYVNVGSPPQAHVLYRPVKGTMTRRWDIAPITHILLHVEAGNVAVIGRQDRASCGMVSPNQ